MWFLVRFKSHFSVLLQSAFPLPAWESIHRVFDFFCYYKAVKLVHDGAEFKSILCTVSNAMSSNQHGRTAGMWMGSEKLWQNRRGSKTVALSTAYTALGVMAECLTFSRWHAMSKLQAGTTPMLHSPSTQFLQCCLSKMHAASSAASIAGSLGSSVCPNMLKMSDGGRLMG